MGLDHTANLRIPFWMRFQNFNMLPHLLPYIFSQFSMVSGFLLRATTRYRQFFFKNINIHFLKNLTVAPGNPLQIASEPCWTERKCMVTSVVKSMVTHWSYGNALHYDLSMFIEFGNVWQHVQT